MMILKSNQGKSKIVDILAANTNSLVYMYDKEMLTIDNCYVVDPDEVSRQTLAKEIGKQMIEEEKNGNHYDYLIIYTNCSETDVISLYYQMDNVEKFPVGDIIITCKE